MIAPWEDEPWEEYPDGMTTGLYPEAEANKFCPPRDDPKEDPRDEPREDVRDEVRPDPREPKPEVRPDKLERLGREPKLNPDPEEPPENGDEKLDPIPDDPMFP